ncbi:ankyrin repeat domain-containing protein [Oceanicaulis alexandrii]|uniref:ankyrin repeat domain-containing protein n=1 Tax=Oceanicaulis alexandrii TaxID=153233 RepID=UPI0035D13663
MSSLIECLETQDAIALSHLLGRLPHLTNAPVNDGRHTPHPLHAICDRVFDARLTEQQGLAFANALISAGADLDAVHPGNGDTLLISAISLSCPSIAHRLLDKGANPDPRGLFGATALHWAAIMGMADLVKRLMDHGVYIYLRDAQYSATPLGWAVQGWLEPPRGARDEHITCAMLLVDAGLQPDADWRNSEQIMGVKEMRQALGWA